MIRIGIVLPKAEQQRNVRPVVFAVPEPAVVSEWAHAKAAAAVLVAWWVIKSLTKCGGSVTA